MLGADGDPLRLPPGGFAQASPSANSALAKRVAELASGSKRILELYAGAGNLTVLLARGAEVLAVESDRAACDAARANLAALALSARIVESDAAAHVVPPGADLVVLDPPRSGARAVAERLAQTSATQTSPREDRGRGGPRRILYVSCDTQTLARDLAILAPRYMLRVAEAFEMFPQTSHVESVVLLEKRHGVRPPQ
jgi:23S rRNA (uracil1939-C5)-methyltransferase